MNQVSSWIRLDRIGGASWRYTLHLFQCLFVLWLQSPGIKALVSEIVDFECLSHSRFWTAYDNPKVYLMKNNFLFNRSFKVKLSPKSNQGFICEWISVKPWCKSIITTKEALLRITVVSFSGKLNFSGVRGHWYASIKITIFKTLRRLNTTWNFVRGITRVSTHEHEHWEHCLCSQSLLKRRFLINSR